MLDIHNLIEDCRAKFDSLINAGIEHAFASIQVPVELDAPLLPPGQHEHVYWARPSENYHAIGLGRIFYQAEKGVQRFKLLQTAYQEYCALWQQPPLAFMAFAFDDEDDMAHEWERLPNAFVSIPRLLIEQGPEHQTLTFNLEVEADLAAQTDEIRRLLEQFSQSVPVSGAIDSGITSRDTEISDKQCWIQIASEAIEAIRQEQFRKLVFSRRKLCEKHTTFDAGILLSRLMKRYPECTIISYLEKGDQFIAATPERLLSLDAGLLQSDAIGGTLSEDEAIQCSYLVNRQSELAQKLLNEHAIIVEDICRRLEPICSTLSVPTAPRLKKLHDIYHLETPVHGRLGTVQTVLSLVERLHPTPAIAGYPASKSVNWLRDNEEYKRGWYTGAFGWMRGVQIGEVSVLLRCALINQTQINVYAGAGLVTESNVEKEWQETELKMKTILDLT